MKRIMHSIQRSMIQHKNQTFVIINYFKVTSRVSFNVPVVYYFSATRLRWLLKLLNPLLIYRRNLIANRSSTKFQYLLVHRDIFVPLYIKLSGSGLCFVPLIDITTSVLFARSFAYSYEIIN